MALQEAVIVRYVEKSLKGKSCRGMPADGKQRGRRKSGILEYPGEMEPPLHFLLPNFHQPPHNNMADPACGTGATQLETQTRSRLVAAGLSAAAA